MRAAEVVWQGAMMEMAGHSYLDDRGGCKGREVEEENISGK